MKIQPNAFHQGAYPAVFAGWQKKWGSAPTDAELQIMHALCSAPGSKHAFACAMMLRDGGAHDFDHIHPATQLIKFVNGVPQVLHNYRDNIVKAGWFTRTSNGKNHSALTLTDKGAAELKRRLGVNNTVDSRAKARSDKHAASMAAARKATRDAAKAKAKATRAKRKASLPAAPVISDAPQVAMPMSIEAALAIPVNTDSE